MNTYVQSTCLVIVVTLSFNTLAFYPQKNHNNKSFILQRNENDSLAVKV
jgi:hypothetical protein